MVIGSAGAVRGQVLSERCPKRHGGTNAQRQLAGSARFPFPPPHAGVHHDAVDDAPRHERDRTAALADRLPRRGSRRRVAEPVVPARPHRRAAAGQQRPARGGRLHHVEHRCRFDEFRHDDGQLDAHVHRLLQAAEGQRRRDLEHRPRRLGVRGCAAEER